MDPEAFLDVANQVVKLKMFPYFDIAHCTLCALSVREDLGSGKYLFLLPTIRAENGRNCGSCGIYKFYDVILGKWETKATDDGIYRSKKKEVLVFSASKNIFLKCLINFFFIFFLLFFIFF